MEMTQAEITGITHVKDMGFYLGVVSFTFQKTGEAFMQNLTLKARVNDNELKSFADIEAAILSKAIETLSHVNSVLVDATPSALFEQITDYKHKQEQAMQASLDSSLEDLLKNSK